MKAPLILPRFLLASALVCAGAAWSASDSTLAAQKTLLENLRTMDFSNPGVLLGGELRSSVNSSVLENDGKSTEIGAYTQGDFILQARPTKDTRATVKFRVHQDWQKSHEEGVSPILFDWWSYDGRAMDGRIAFNLGDMRLRYTPLTMSTPALNLLQEPELLYARRQDVMDYRHLDDSEGRLLQGLNFSYGSGVWTVFDDLSVQGTLARLRNQAKKPDQIFYDFDDSDRYLLAGRAGVSAYGVSLGANYVNAFDREKSARNFFSSTVALDSVLLEDNTVLSFSAGVDAARILGLNGWKLRLDAEYALSSYKSTWLRKGQVQQTITSIDSIYVGIGDEDVLAHYVTPKTQMTSQMITEDVDDIDGSAFLATVDFAPPVSAGEASVILRWVQNDKDYQSDLAQSPIYFSPGTVLNAPAFDTATAGSLLMEQLRSSTMENLYFAVYRNDPLTRINLASGNDNEVGDEFLFNNYKKGHFFRTGYTNGTLTRQERIAIPVIAMDPAVNLSMPWGLATPDRQGVLLDAQWLVLDGNLELEARFNRLTQDEISATFTDIGAGAAVELGRLLGWERRIRLNAGYSKSTESDGFERSSSRITAGGRVGIWKGLSLLGAWEVIEKDYGTVFDSAVTGKESLLLVGPELRITQGASLNVQGGVLSHEFTFAEKSLTLDRTLMSADIRVKF